MLLGDDMTENDWVMTNDYVGQILATGGMFCQICVVGEDKLAHRKLVMTDEIRLIPKEVADIIRSV